MIAEDLITHSIPTLKTSDTGQIALNFMEEYKISHLPIVNNTELLGLISEDDIILHGNFQDPIGNHKLSLVNPYVHKKQHIYDVVKFFSKDKLTLLPVVNEKNTYCGSILLSSLVHSFSKLSAIDQPGAIIILELNQNDYYLSQIVHIIESNDTKVLSVYIHEHPETTKMHVTIKVNKTDIFNIIQTFNRYNYTIKETYSEEIFDDLKERFDAFMNYLNM